MSQNISLFPPRSLGWRRGAQLATLGLASVSLLCGACSSSDDEDEGNGTKGGFVNENGTVAGGIIDNSGEGGGLIGDGSGSGNSAGSGTDNSQALASGDLESCASSTRDADIKPVDMYIVFDRSSSMQDDNKWEDATTALVAFLQDSGTADLGIALRFYPDNDPNDGCDNVGCNVDACQAPLVDVGIVTSEPGDAQETALVNAINAKDALETSLGTPTYEALGGAIQWSEARLTSNPDRAPIIVLVTDGDPNGCEPNDQVGNITPLAEGGYDNGVRTYVIGLAGSEENTIDRIAEAGGTGQGIFIGGADSDASTDLIAALEDIRGQALACDFPTPAAAEGEIVDLNAVNITLTKSDGSSQIFYNVAGEGDCGGDASWYYAEGDSSRILLCPTACEAVTGDDQARLDVILGCATTPLPITMK